MLTQQVDCVDESPAIVPLQDWETLRLGMYDWATRAPRGHKLQRSGKKWMATFEAVFIWRKHIFLGQVVEWSVVCTCVILVSCGNRAY